MERTDLVEGGGGAAWIDCGTYYISNAEQRSPEWHKTRTGRVTASNFGTCAGHSRFSGPEALAHEIAGLKEKTFSDNSRRVMDYGTETEPKAREWYERTRNVKVKEYGLAVPKWNIYIGGSPDGIIEGTDGIIEIKCPEKMYGPLKERMTKPPPSDPYCHSHIWPTHYDQMQGCMAILNKSYCDYIVFSPPDGLAYVERIHFNRAYWETQLYPKIQEFLEVKLKPLLKQQGIEVQVPSVSQTVERAR